MCSFVQKMFTEHLIMCQRQETRPLHSQTFHSSWGNVKIILCKNNKQVNIMSGRDQCPEIKVYWLRITLCELQLWLGCGCGGLFKYVNLRTMKVHDLMCFLRFNPSRSQQEVPRGEKSEGSTQLGMPLIP